MKRGTIEPRKLFQGRTRSESMLGSSGRSTKSMALTWSEDALTSKYRMLPVHQLSAPPSASDLARTGFSRASDLPSDVPGPA